MVNSGYDDTQTIPTSSSSVRKTLAGSGNSLKSSTHMHNVYVLMEHKHTLHCCRNTAVTVFNRENKLSLEKGTDILITGPII